MSVACQVNWAANFVVGIGWPYLHQALGPCGFVPFGLLLLATFLFTWQYLPETAGRSIAEVQMSANEPKAGRGFHKKKAAAGGGAPGAGGYADDGAGDASNAMQYVVVEGVDLSMN